MTENYVSIWMAQGRHYRVRFVDQTIDNIHLRIANDVYLFVQRTHELATGLLGSIVALALLRLHPVGALGHDAAAAVRRRLAFPGYLIWAALLYAGDRHPDRALDRLATDPAQFQPAALRSRLPLRHRARGRPFRADRADARGGGGAHRAAPALRQSGAQLDRARAPAGAAHRLHRRLFPCLDRVPDAGREPGLSARAPFRSARWCRRRSPSRRSRAPSPSASAPTASSRNGRRSWTGCRR